MFILTAAELDNAFSAIQHHGYSTMLPDPPEWNTVVANWDNIRSTLCKIDLDVYEPFKALKVFSPKNRANVRVLYLLHPQDLLIYTALVLIAKDDLENSRVPTSKRRVFSYRSNASDACALYDVRGSHESYRARMKSKAIRPSVKFIAVADIADFYPRIYQHRLENIIESVATSDRVREVARVLVSKLISKLMERNSYGIPVGPYASRLLGEAILIDVDATLQSKGIDFVRWVDDYTIFCRSERDAQSALFLLGEWLYSNHGLTLQSAKTTILEVSTFISRHLNSHDDTLTDRDSVVRMLREFQIGYEGQQEGEDATEEDIQKALEKLQSTDLEGILQDSIRDSALIDYEAVVYSLSRLPRIPGAPSTLKRDVLRVVIENAAQLYPVAEQVARYVLSFDDLTRAERKRIANRLLAPLRRSPQTTPPYYTMWILHIFASDPQWNHISEIAGFYSATTSDVVKRYAALAIGAAGSRSEAVALKSDYAAAHPLLRSAILVASHRLGTDERKHWKLSNTVSGAIEKLI